MTTTTIQKWGNSYAVRLPKDVILNFNLQAGHSVEIHEAIHDDKLSIVPVRKKLSSLSEMVGRITKDNRHSATNWGSAVGKEVW